FDTLADDFTKSHRNSISNKAAKALKTNFLIGLNKLIILWKSLNDCPFAQRDSPVLSRVTKSTISKSKKLSCHRWCRFVPIHSSVNTWIGGSTFFLVTFRY